MISIRCLEFLLFLLFHRVCNGEPEPMIRAQGSIIEMGYCFGVDYIVVYRSAPEGDQLLGNSSETITPPADLLGRISTNQFQHLLGLQISNLTQMDSGIYRRECWQNHSLINQHIHKLSVCDEEVTSKEIIVKEDDGKAELLCNSTFTGLEGTSVQWYHEMYPDYKLTLFLDSNVLLAPLMEELQSKVEVKDRGALLVLDSSLLNNNHHFYCLVIRGQNCLSFQNMYLPDRIESMEIFASPGDRVVLQCPAEGINLHWETPLGSINDSCIMNNHMCVSLGDKDFSLVIPAVSDIHTGDYFCISSSSEMQYILFLCPKSIYKKIDFDGRNALLECDTDQAYSPRVQWYRQETSGVYKLIYDSGDETISIPEDLRGTLAVSKNGSLLTISSLDMKDEVVYRCVVLEGRHFLEVEDDYKVEYNEEDAEYVEFDHSDWPRTHLCTSTLNYNTSTADPEADSNVTLPAVGAGIVFLVLVGVIVAVVVLRKRAKHRREAENDIKMKEDPTCRRLTDDGV